MTLKLDRSVYAADTGDNNDCMVRALATAACVPYAEVHAVMAAHGRKANQGTPWTTVDAAMSHFAPGVRRESARVNFVGDPTLRQFAEQHATGHYVVILANSRRAHAVALIDGVLHDHGRYSLTRDSAGYIAGTSRMHAGQKRRVRFFWKLI